MMPSAKTLGWIIFGLGAYAGMMLALFYAAWATRHLEQEANQMRKELNMWRAGWKR